jgi:hypothetical protein
LKGRENERTEEGKEEDGRTIRKTKSEKGTLEEREIK